MIGRVVLAIVVGIVVWLVCEFVGGLLVSIVGPSWVTATGDFLRGFGSLLGLLAALWYFFAGTRP